MRQREALVYKSQDKEQERNVFCCSVCLSDMGDLLRPRNLNSAVYSLLTAAFLGLGGACILAPPGVLNGVLAHANTPDALLVWQSYGGALLLLPSWSFTLKVRMATNWCEAH